MVTTRSKRTYATHARKIPSGVSKKVISKKKVTPKKTTAKTPKKAAPKAKKTPVAKPALPAESKPEPKPELKPASPVEPETEPKNARQERRNAKPFVPISRAHAERLEKLHRVPRAQGKNGDYHKLAKEFHELLADRVISGETLPGRGPEEAKRALLAEMHDMLKSYYFDNKWVDAVREDAKVFYYNFDGDGDGNEEDRERVYQAWLKTQWDRIHRTCKCHNHEMFGPFVWGPFGWYDGRVVEAAPHVVPGKMSQPCGWRKE